MTTPVPDPSTLPTGRRTGGLAQAARLRRLGLSYPAISRVMGEYHGMHYSAGHWRHLLRARGVQARPRGVAFGASHQPGRRAA